MGFTSEQHDASGLIYLRYRYLDPTVGQFISVDHMLSSTLDAYGYASGNPLQMTDPLGLYNFRDQLNNVPVADPQQFLNNVDSAKNYIYENSGNISTGLSVASLGFAVSGVGAPIGVALGVLSGISAYKNFSEGNIADGWVDVASGILAFGGGGAYIRSSYQASKALAASAPSRRALKNNIRAATKQSNAIQKQADNSSAGLLIGTNAGKGALC